MISMSNMSFILRLNASQIVTAVWDHKVKFWDMKTVQCLKTLYSFNGEVICLEKINGDHIAVRTANG